MADARLDISITYGAVPRRTLDTVLGPLKVVPECMTQAVCVNGSKCWEAGYCLRDPKDGSHES